MYRTSFLLTSIVATAFCTTISHAAISNASFESTNGAGAFGGSFPQAADWDGDTGTATHAAFTYGNNGALGTRFVFFQPDLVQPTQTLADTFVPNMQYTFQGYGVDNGINNNDVRFEIGYDDGGFQFLAGATYDLDNLDWTLLDGVTYSTGAGGAEIGNAIVVRLVSVFVDVPASNGGVFLDNVSLSIVPEPASLAILGFGGLLLIRRRRQ